MSLARSIYEKKKTIISIQAGITGKDRLLLEKDGYVWGKTPRGLSSTSIPMFFKRPDTYFLLIRSFPPPPFNLSNPR